MKLDIICDGCKTTNSVEVTKELNLKQAVTLVKRLDKVLKKHTGHIKFVHFKTIDDEGMVNKYMLQAFRTRIKENERA